jgi:hypothetical protein
MTGIELFTVGTTAVTLGQALGAAATVAGVAGAYGMAQSQANSAEYQANVAKQESRQARADAAEESADFLKRQRLMLSSARANRAASGVDITQGSPLLTDLDLVNEIAKQNERIRRGGSMSSNRLQQQANLNRMAARGYRTAGTINAGSTLLGGISEFG